MILDEEFLLLNEEYSSKNTEFEPLVSTWELAFRSPWPQLEKVFTCAMAVVLQKYFRLASVVPKPSGVQVPYWWRLLDLGSKLYPGNMQHMLNKDLTWLVKSLSRVQQNWASQRKAPLAGWERDNLEQKISVCKNNRSAGLVSKTFL